MSAPAAPLVLAIPTYCAGEFLEATLESLAAQGPSVRWYLQDALSPDQTVAIAHRHQRPGDVVLSERDGGQADGINRAMRAMGGEIIGFINGDDCLCPGAAERVLAYFAEHPEVDLVCGGIEWIDAQGALTGRHFGRIESLAEVLDIYGVWWRARQWVQPEVFYRRSLWERVGGFDTRYHLAFDYDFWVRCFLVGARVAHLPHPLARFRHHATQKSAASERAADEIRAIVQTHLPAARIPLATRWSIGAQLGYDLYQLGRAEPRRALAAELLRHPGWLLAPALRARLQSACRRLVPGAQASASR